MQIYIHTPFCKRKCRYCSFLSSADYDQSVIDSYVDALLRNIAYLGEKYSYAKVDTIYFGGGTPSVLSEKNLSGIFDILNKSFYINTNAEITVEGNPESLSIDKMRSIHAYGVNRLSVGVQSLLDKNLKAVGRLHDSALALKALESAASVFDNVSADLIVGLPFDTPDTVTDETKTLLPYIKHLSAYMLSVEENTPLYDDVKSKLLFLPDDDKTVDLLKCVQKVLSENGFSRYEVSNFALDNYHSRHNTGYWKREEYLGIGLGASSFLKTSDGKSPIGEQIRYKNVSSLGDYLRAVNTLETCSDIPLPTYGTEVEYLTKDDQIKEETMLGLRLKEGVRSELIRDKVAKLGKKYLCFFNIGSERISLTDRGMDVMNSLLCELI